jgi:hypothetical protein
LLAVFIHLSKTYGTNTCALLGTRSRKQATSWTYIWLTGQGKLMPTNFSNDRKARNPEGMAILIMSNDTI